MSYELNGNYDELSYLCFGNDHTLEEVSWMSVGQGSEDLN